MTTALRADIDLTTVEAWEAFVRADQCARDVGADAYLLPPQMTVTIHNNRAEALGEIGDYISCTVTPKLNATSGATIVLKGSDPWVAVAATCVYTTVPVTIETSDGFYWSGIVDTCGDDEVNGVGTVTLQCVGNWDWFHRVLVFPTWWMPLEAQIIKETVYVGPAVTTIKTLIAEQCLRQSGLIGAILQGANNIINPAAFLGSLLTIDELAIPIVVVPNNPITDTSRWTVMTCRMPTIAEAVSLTLKANGLMLTAELWKPGMPQPAPEWMTLTEACIVVDIKDRTNVRGITGTAVDGLIGEAVSLVDTVLAEILALVGIDDVSDSLSTDATNPYGSGILAGFLGLDATPPWVVYEDGPRSGIVESHVTGHHPLAWRVIGGGKSPEWVNKGIDLLLESGLSMLLAAFGASGISSTLLDGLFDNLFLAFQQMEDEPRRIRMGKFGRPEFFVSTGSAAYTADEQLALFGGLWDTRGFFSFSLTTQNRYPYSFGCDFWGTRTGDFGIGDPVSWIRRGILYTDYCTEATLTDDRTHRVQLIAKIGDQSAVESPWAKLGRKWQSVNSAVKAAALAQN